MEIKINVSSLLVIIIIELLIFFFSPTVRLTATFIFKLTFLKKIQLICDYKVKLLLIKMTPRRDLFIDEIN